MIDCLHTENTKGNGGPQGDSFGERQLSKIGQQLKEVFIKLKQVSGINRKLKKKNIYPQMTRMVTDGGPQADFVGELLLTNDEELFASSSSYASS